MKTQCTPTQLEFRSLGRREIIGNFDGGTIASDAGGLLLRETEKRTGIISGFAKCFEDLRYPDLIEHTVAELIAQLICGLALGYEDLNDHDYLRRDPVLAMLAEKEDPEGSKRKRSRDRGEAGAGKSTLNRLELTPAALGRGIGTGDELQGIAVREFSTLPGNSLPPRLFSHPCPDLILFPLAPQDRTSYT